jgi:hypothetical protein
MAHTLDVRQLSRAKLPLRDYRGEEAQGDHPIDSRRITIAGLTERGRGAGKTSHG